MLDSVRSQLPTSWLGDDPQNSKYIRLKRSLETVRHWLHEFQRPFRGYKMPMDSDAQDQHDDPADVKSWNNAETDIQVLGDELKDHLDLEAAKAASAPKPEPAEPLRKSNMSDDPVRFTDDQRELFRRVAYLIRSGPQAFQSAGQWLDAGADLAGAKDRIKGVRNLWLSEARSRRHATRNRGRDVGRRYLIPREGPTLHASRIALARRIRDERAMAGRDPTPYEIIESAAQSLLSEPPNYDALRPDLAEGQARRVLLVAWVLTDPRSLQTNPGVSKLQGWVWGGHPLDWLATGTTANGDLDLDAPREISRLYARTTLLDDHLAEWVKLAGDAMRYLDDLHTVESGTTTQASSLTEPPFNASAPERVRDSNPVDGNAVVAIVADRAGTEPRLLWLKIYLDQNPNATLREIEVAAKQTGHNLPKSSVNDILRREKWIGHAPRGKRGKANSTDPNVIAESMSGQNTRRSF
jgi:hypothetical protein